MERYENSQTSETTKDIIVRELTDEKNGLAFAREYLKADFLSAAVDALFSARRQAGLTQAEVAERLHTKQAAIARLEADTEGSMSLRRYVEFALACDMIPHEIVLSPVEAVRRYVIENPEAAWTQVAYAEWLKPSSQSLSIYTGDTIQVTGNIVLSTANVAPFATTLQGIEPTFNMVEVQPQVLQMRFSGGATIAQPEPQNQASTVAQPLKRQYEEAA